MPAPKGSAGAGGGTSRRLETATQKYQGATRVSRNEEIEWRKRRLERGGQKPTGRGGGVEERRKVEEERWRR